MKDQDKNPIMAAIAAEQDYTGYFGVYRHIQRATFFISKVTGEQVELTLSDKVVLYYLIDQIGYSVGQLQKPLVASMTKIAVHLGLNDRTVSRAVKKLVEHGIVLGTIESKAVGYAYTGVDATQQFGSEVSDGVVKRMRPNPINVKSANDDKPQETPVVAVVQDQTKPVVTLPVEVQEAFPTLTPDDGMPDHLYAPEFDYSDVFNQMANTDYEPRVGVMAEDFDYGMMDGHSTEQAA